MWKFAGTALIILLLLQINALSKVDAEAYSLLQDVTEKFTLLNRTKNIDPKKFDTLFISCMEKAKQLKKEKRIDEAFFKRYRRVLAVLKLMTIDDPHKILTPLRADGISKFKVMTKQTFPEDEEKRGEIDLVTSAVALELIDLGRYLKKIGKKQ